MYINRAIKIYLEDLAARQSTPGGGSAAALCGGIGAALLEMVCNFTSGNKNYKAIEDIINKHRASLQKIRGEFSRLVDEDIKIYNNIRQAFKTKDIKIIDIALKQGYYISSKICEMSVNCAGLALDLSRKGNVNLITDVGCAIESLRAAFNSGVFNAEINLKAVHDVSFKEEASKKLTAMQKRFCSLYSKVIVKTKKRMP